MYVYVARNLLLHVHSCHVDIKFRTVPGWFVVRTWRFSWRIRISPNLCPLYVPIPSQLVFRSAQIALTVQPYTVTSNTVLDRIFTVDLRTIIGFRKQIDRERLSWHRNIAWLNSMRTCVCRTRNWRVLLCESIFYEEQRNWFMYLGIPPEELLLTAHRCPLSVWRDESQRTYKFDLLFSVYTYIVCEQSTN